MSQPSRRTFLAGAAAALAARPAFGQGGASGPAADVDAIIVGAGAAGIAAARRLSAAGRSFTMVEAAGRVGGRCFTDTRSFNVPFDRGAHWILSPDINPLSKLAPRTGLDIYQAPSGQRVRIGERNAREGELEDYLSAIVRSNRGIAETVRGKADMDCLRALPKDLGDWQATVEFTLGPYATGRDLREMSAQDFSKSVERDIAAFCRQGYGALLAKLAEGIPVEMDSPITAVDTSRGARVEATTPRGTISGRYMICTASIGVLASERIKFDRGLPKRQQDALAALKLGSLDHIALDLPGNPLGLQRDDLVFEKAYGPRTAALLANVSGTSLSVIEVGGKFGRDLMAQGDMASVDFAVQWLVRPVRQQRQERGAAHAGDALEQRAMGDGRDVDGVARRPVGACRVARADARAGLFRRRSHPRHAVGHGGRRLGIRRARCRSGAAALVGTCRSRRRRRQSLSPRHRRRVPPPRKRSLSHRPSLSPRRNQNPRRAVPRARAKPLARPGVDASSSERGHCYRASCSFSHATIIVAIASAGWPGVRPM